MKYTIIILLTFVSMQGWSHPVSFQDSMGVMGQHGPRLSHVQWNYSWRYWWATGLHHFNVRQQDQNRTTQFLSTNFLLKRWNGSDYQANLYAVAGVGPSFRSESSKVSGMGLLQFDIEDRKYYFMSRYLRTQVDRTAELEQKTVRLGVSPYQGHFSELQSWFILEWQQQIFLMEPHDTQLTSYIRLFYRNVLFEIGHSFTGDVRFNYISHF